VCVHTCMCGMLQARVARFFLTQFTQKRENIPNCH
jgi:hypothetical protein